MSEEFLPIIYLSILLVLLGIVAIVLGRQIFKTRRVESTFSNLQNKLKQEKGTAKDYYELGSIYLEKKLYRQAVLLFEKGLKANKEIEPENQALIYNALGFAYFSQEQYDLAIRNYKEAIKLYPEYVTALNNLGNAYEKKQLTVQALETYNQVLEYEPNNKKAKKRVESLSKRVVTS
jgi:tetratricopeptide (TPR) repeat protein